MYLFALTHVSVGWRIDFSFGNRGLFYLHSSVNTWVCICLHLNSCRHSAVRCYFHVTYTNTREYTTWLKSLPSGPDVVRSQCDLWKKTIFNLCKGAAVEITVSTGAQAWWTSVEFINLKFLILAVTVGVFRRFWTVAILNFYSGAGFHGLAMQYKCWNQILQVEPLQISVKLFLVLFFQGPNWILIAAQISISREW